MSSYRLVAVAVEQHLSAESFGQLLELHDRCTLLEPELIPFAENEQEELEEFLDIARTNGKVSEERMLVLVDLEQMHQPGNDVDHAYGERVIVRRWNVHVGQARLSVAR